MTAVISRKVSSPESMLNEPATRPTNQAAQHQTLTKQQLTIHIHPPKTTNRSTTTKTTSTTQPPNKRSDQPTSHRLTNSPTHQLNQLNITQPTQLTQLNQLNMTHPTHPLQGTWATALPAAALAPGAAPGAPCADVGVAARPGPGIPAPCGAAAS